MYGTMAKTKLIPGQTDLATINPTLSMEWHPEKNTGLTPMQVTAGSMKKVWWKCEKGHEWQATIYDRNHGTGCPVCNNHTRRRLILGKNDLATVNPALAAELHPVKNGDLTARDLTAQSNQKVWWLCKHGHEWQTAVFQRTRGTGCPICAYTKPVQHPVIPLSEDSTLSAQWHPSLNGALSPEMISATSKEKVWWQCEYGHAWQASVHFRNL